MTLAELIRGLWREDGLFDAVTGELSNAVEKHGTEKLPSSGALTLGAKLIILVEEVGEVARACTYDEGDKAKRKAELIQVAAMALAWAASEE
jgi:hypothetical protein